MEKIKDFIKRPDLKDIYLVLIVILVGLSAFELGRLYDNPKGFLTLNYQALPEQSLKSKPQSTLTNAKKFLETNPSLEKSSQTQNQKFFASKRGKKYYSLDCSAGKSIKTENRIYFDSAEKAEQKGYEKSASCK